AGARECGSVALAAEYSGLPIAFSPTGDVLALTGCRPGLAMPGCEGGEVMVWRRAPHSKPAQARGMIPVALGADSRALALCRVHLGPQSASRDADSAKLRTPHQYGELPAEGVW